MEKEAKKSENKKKIFNTTQKLFECVGIYRNHAFENHRINWKSATILVFLIQNFIFATLFLLIKANTFDEYFECFYYTACILLNIVVIGEFIRENLKINELISSFENTIEKRAENPSSKQMYEKMNEKIEKTTEMLHFCLFNLTLPGVLIPNLIVSYFIYFTTDSSSDAFRLAFPMWLPFEWKTPFGYLIAFSIQSATFYFIALCSGGFLCFLMGSCEMLQTLSEDVKNDLHAMDEFNKTDGNPVKLKEKMCEFIKRFSDARQFAIDFSHIYKFIITACFLWSLTTICVTLLIVQMELNSGNLIELVRPLTLIFWSFAVQFLLCNLGEQVSNRLEAITDAIYECDWYSFPIEIQKMSLTVMTATQKPVIFRGFGNILLTRDTFKMVANGGFSYFTVLRRFNN